MTTVMRRETEEHTDFIAVVEVRGKVLTKLWAVEPGLEEKFTDKITKIMLAELDVELRVADVDKIESVSDNEASYVAELEDNGWVRAAK